jgi:hypothetical protein
MPGARDLITETNVVKTYKKGKYICFLLNNGFTVTLDPNQAPGKGSGAATKGVSHERPSTVG